MLCSLDFLRLINQIASRHLLLTRGGFFDFPQTIRHQHRTFSVAVRLSLARILRQIRWWSVPMVTRYDVISSRWSNHFWVKIHIFQPFWTIKVKTRWWNDTKCFFIPFISILSWFLVLGEIQDGDNDWWLHWPPAAPPPLKYTPSCWEDQKLSSKGKIVLKHYNI